MVFQKLVFSFEDTNIFEKNIANEWSIGLDGVHSLNLLLPNKLFQPYIYHVKTIRGREQLFGVDQSPPGPPTR